MGVSIMLLRWKITSFLLICIIALVNISDIVEQHNNFHIVSNEQIENEKTIIKKGLENKPQDRQEKRSNSEKSITQLTTSSAGQTEPDIYRDKIVWQDSKTGGTDIYMFDLSTNTETQITTNRDYQDFPAIYGNIIVWEDCRNGFTRNI